MKLQMFNCRNHRDRTLLDWVIRDNVKIVSTLLDLPYGPSPDDREIQLWSNRTEIEQEKWIPCVAIRRFARFDNPFSVTLCGHIESVSSTRPPISDSGSVRRIKLKMAALTCRPHTDFNKLQYCSAVPLHSVSNRASLPPRVGEATNAMDAAGPSRYCRSTWRECRRWR
jgi:hypothetical protein